MSWLTPLGFLGLIGLIVLIIIYIIKPNYQNKFISSNFIFKYLHQLFLLRRLAL